MRAVTLLLMAAAASADFPYPPGQSTQNLQGIDTWLVVPAELAAERPASLVVVLHGSGGTASGMAGTLASWADRNYVICAPQAKGMSWTPDELKAILRIAADLKKTLPIDPKKVHTIGFSNGGWNLAPLAFDDELRPCSATWVAAGYNGGSVPKWAKAGLGVLALAGGDDPNAASARQTVPALREKVRSAEVRIQPGIGHTWPDALNAYLAWWVDVQEGRFTPGEDRNFDWTDDLEAAKADLAGRKKGGIVAYFFQASDAERAEARDLQNRVLMDPLVRHYGAQLIAVKIDLAAGSAQASALGVTGTPALALIGKDGKVSKTFTGKIPAKTLAAALRALAPDKKPPEN